MRLLTGNDLKTGAVTWWTGSDWSIHVEDAADVAGSEDEIARREEAARRVNSPYAVDAELHDGSPGRRISRSAFVRLARPSVPT